MADNDQQAPPSNNQYGPFTSVLTDPLKISPNQPIAAPQPSGFQNRAGTLAMFADQFLRGIQQGRRAQFERSEQQKAQNERNYDSVYQHIRDGNYTPEAKQAAEKAWIQAKYAPVHEELASSKGDDSHPGLHLIKSIASAVGGPTSDPNHKDFGSSGGGKGKKGKNQEQQDDPVHGLLAIANDPKNRVDVNAIRESSLKQIGDVINEARGGQQSSTTEPQQGPATPPPPVTGATQNNGFPPAADAAQSPTPAPPVPAAQEQQPTAPPPQAGKYPHYAANNNPGNLKFVGQAGATKGLGGFAAFQTPEAGVQAYMRQVHLDAGRGLNLQQFITKYAPPSENNTAQYVQQATQALGVSADTPLSKIPPAKLAQFQLNKESGTKLDASGKIQPAGQTPPPPVPQAQQQPQQAAPAQQPTPPPPGTPQPTQPPPGAAQVQSQQAQPDVSRETSPAGQQQPPAQKPPDYTQQGILTNPKVMAALNAMHRAGIDPMKEPQVLEMLNAIPKTPTAEQQAQTELSQFNLGQHKREAAGVEEGVVRVPGKDGAPDQITTVYRDPYSKQRFDANRKPIPTDSPLATGEFMDSKSRATLSAIQERATDKPTSVKAADGGVMIYNPITKHAEPMTTVDGKPVMGKPTATSEFMKLSPKEQQDSIDGYAVARLYGTEKGQLRGEGSVPINEKIEARAVEMAADVGVSKGQMPLFAKAFMKNGEALGKLEVQKTMVGQFERTVQANLKLLEDLNAKYDRTDFKFPNRIEAYLRGEYSDPDVIKYMAQIKTVANEYAKVMQGGSGNNGATVNSQKEAEEMFNRQISAHGIQSLIDGVIKPDLSNRMKAFDDERAALTSKMQIDVDAPKDSNGIVNGQPTPPPPVPNAKNGQGQKDQPTASPYSETKNEKHTVKMQMSGKDGKTYEKWVSPDDVEFLKKQGAKAVN